jgi:hypothetical protein
VSLVCAFAVSPFVTVDLMPGFVIFTLLALTVGGALLGWTVLRSRVLPRWAGVLLILGLVPLFWANEQTDSILLAIPFGLAWIAVGTLLVSKPRGRTPTSR